MALVNIVKTEKGKYNVEFMGDESLLCHITWKRRSKSVMFVNGEGFDFREKGREITLKGSNIKPDPTGKLAVTFTYHKDLDDYNKRDAEDYKERIRRAVWDTPQEMIAGIKEASTEEEAQTPRGGIFRSIMTVLTALGLASSGSSEKRSE
jgi:hypothetical protein